jgi:competence protein ComEA
MITIKRIVTTLSTFAFVCASYLAAAPAHAALGEPGDTEQVTRSAGLEGKVNINSASTAELELLPGIGPATAARILEYRREHPFESVGDIVKVKGVGEKTYAKIKPFLAVEGQTTLRVVK